MNLILFGTASSCPETMLTAMRSSFESPKEIICRGGCSDCSATSQGEDDEVRYSSSMEEVSERDDVDDTSVPSMLAQDVVSSAFFNES